MPGEQQGRKRLLPQGLIPRPGDRGIQLARLPSRCTRPLRHMYPPGHRQQTTCVAAGQRDHAALCAAMRVSKRLRAAESSKEQVCPTRLLQDCHHIDVAVAATMLSLQDQPRLSACDIARQKAPPLLSSLCGSMLSATKRRAAWGKTAAPLHLAQADSLLGPGLEHTHWHRGNPASCSQDLRVRWLECRDAAECLVTRWSKHRGQ